MRRFLSAVALALCLCLISACGAEDVLEKMTGRPAAETVQEDSGTDAAGEAELPPPETGDASGTDAQAPAGQESGGDFTALSAEECVTDDWPDPGVLPRITLDCPGAAAINKAIQDDFFLVAEDPLWDLHYECGKGAGHILSVVMVKEANDWEERTVYNLDLATGQAVTGGELPDLLGVDRDALLERELTALGEEFERQFAGMRDQMDPAFYDEQYARTTSPDNGETERLWFRADGQLCFAGRIYPIAGAEYYEYELSTGWAF